MGLPSCSLKDAVVEGSGEDLLAINPRYLPPKTTAKVNPASLMVGQGYGVAFFMLAFFSNCKKGLERMYSPLRGVFSLTESLQSLNMGLVFFENGKATQPEI